MASGQTGRYGLNQWQPEDKVLREEFNGDNQKMEQALTGLDDRVASKAEQTEVDGLKNQLATKASQSALDSLSAQVSAKAAQSTVDSLSASMAAGLAKKYGTDNSYLTSGNYTGTGAASVSVSLGFRPALVILIRITSASSYEYIFLMGNAAAQVRITQGASQSVSTTSLIFSDTGFTVSDSLEEYGFNAKGVAYYYIAFR